MAARRGKKRAIIAIGHSILKSVYHVLSEHTAYKELGAAYVNDKQKKKRKQYLQKELEKLGYTVSLADTESQATVSV